MLKNFNDIKAGERFKYGGFDWIKLKNELSVLEYVLEYKIFDLETNNWKKSKLREYLNKDFYLNLIKEGSSENDFRIIDTDLTSADGLKDYGFSEDRISLMTSDIYKDNRELLEVIDQSFWLATPYSCIEKSRKRGKFVSFLGTVSSEFVYKNKHGVRPVINISPKTPVLLKKQNLKAEDSIDLVKRLLKSNNLNKKNPQKEIIRIIESVGKISQEINKEENIEQQEKVIFDSVQKIYISLMSLSIQLGVDIKKCVDNIISELN